ncbi:hypothetical protein U1700_09620 [Sphingomonas sp. RB1R13]
MDGIFIERHWQSFPRRALASAGHALAPRMLRSAPNHRPKRHLQYRRRDQEALAQQRDIVLVVTENFEDVRKLIRELLP